MHDKNSLPLPIKPKHLEMAQSWIQYLLLILVLPLRSSQLINLKNIETFYPTSPAEPPSSRSDIAKAVAATAAGTLVLAALFFFVLQRYCLSRRQKQSQQGVTPNQLAGPPVATFSEFSRVDGNVKGLIVEEDGLDVLYWRSLEERSGYVKEVLQKKPEQAQEEEEDGRDRSRNRSKKREPVQEVPLLREKSSTSYDFERVQPETQDKHQIQADAKELKAVGKQVSPPPPPIKKGSPPPPPPPVSANKKTPAPAPPPPPNPNGSKPPPAPAPPKGVKSEAEVNDKVKLKPLHWDKVNTNTEHSMVWNKLDKGSFKFDGDLMEALFGYVATNRSPRNNKPAHAAPSSSSQIAILDPRKSQNIAIVLKSLGISRHDIINSLEDGQGLEFETIDKLTRIAPTKDEEAKIISFAGDPTRLADGESFLHHLLKSVPSAFDRLNAMHFRSLYGSEMAHLKESLQTLESACNGLRTRGLFMKLLEGILKAGNRMNAGTARGNAQAFNLTALRRLSDVKSTDGKTTLLHFVVEEVVRSEGKRCVINQNRSLNRTDSLSSSMSKEERDKQYTMLGLPVLGGLSSEFTNVKRSAGIDYDSFAGTCSNLSTRVSESQRLVERCEADGEGRGGFVREMKAFLDNAEEEIKVVGEEQRRVMELVKITTEYYQAGASKDRGAAPLQLFVIVKDFLSMVDQVCIKIARDLQKKTAATPSSANTPAKRSTAKFPILPKHFLSDKSGSNSSESDNE